MKKTQESTANLQPKLQLQKRKKARDMQRFAVIVGVIVGSFLLVSSVVAYFYAQPAVAQSDADSAAGTQSNLPQAANMAQTEDNKATTGFIANLLLPPEKTNFLVAGIDAGDMLTDAILVGSFDRETQQITVISIPRDTRVTLPKEDIKELNDLRRYPPSHGVMKINAISAYGGKDYGIAYLKRHLERMLGIEIHYYAMVDLRAFRNIVDAVGGVYMEIPGRGFYYDDPEQSLRIRVPGGYQLLDGEKAEGVVRFRATYREGDLQRIGVQQEFMKQFFAQVINKDNIMKNLGSFLMTVINYVRTDFGLTDIPLYLRYASSINAENITFLTLPGYAPSYNEGEASYFFYDPELTAQMVREIFYNNLMNREDEEENFEGVVSEAATETSGNVGLLIGGVKADIEGLRVQMLNGGASAESFEKLAHELETIGVAVVEKGAYTGARRTGIRILVHETDTIERLRPYFSNITGEISASLSQRFDAVIIVGSSEL